MLRLPPKIARQSFRGRLLSTCNRVEIYGVSPWVHGVVHQLFRELTNTDLDFTPYLYVKEGAEAVQHLFSVASGLESMAFGETEITGQVKSAYETAKAAGLTGKKMNRLFQTACRVVKKNPHADGHRPGRDLGRQRGGGTGGKDFRP